MTRLRRAGQCGLALTRGPAHGRLMLPRSPLDNPATAGLAWVRYRRLMRFMFMVTVGTVAVSFGVLYHFNGLVSIHLYIAAGIGVGFSMLLMSALMGLVFLSSGTGHDEALTGQDGQVPAPESGNDSR
jgi:hypothetical protein